MKRLLDGCPVHGQVVVTYECNLSCRYCHEYTHGAPLVPFDAIARRIDALAALGTFVFDFLGGEPLLHPDIVAIVAHAKATRRGVNFATVITNAFKLTPALVDGFNDAGLDCMQVSVDTIEPEDGLPKSLRSVLPRLELLAERARFAVKIQTVLTEESWRRYGEFRELLSRFDFEFGFSLLHDGAGRIGVRGPEFAEMLRHHKLFPGMAFFRRHAAEMLVGDFSRPWKCLGGFKYLYVNADGRTAVLQPGAGRAAERRGARRRTISRSRTSTSRARPGAPSAACEPCRTRWRARSAPSGRRSRSCRSFCAAARIARRHSATARAPGSATAAAAPGPRTPRACPSDGAAPASRFLALHAFRRFVL